MFSIILNTKILHKSSFIYSIDEFFCAKKSCRFQQLSQLVHHRPLVFRLTVSINIQRDRSIAVPENFRQRFDVHSSFERSRCERVPQTVYTHMRQIQFF